MNFGFMILRLVWKLCVVLGNRFPDYGLNLHQSRLQTENAIKWFICTESIYELGYFGRALRSPTKQFKNVQILHLDQYTFARQSELPSRFPNVRQLKFNNLYPSNCLAVNFPHLEHLDGSLKPLEKPFFVKFIQLNRQLQSLKLHGRFDITFFEAFSGGHSLNFDLRAFNVEIQSMYHGTKSFHINGVKKVLICHSFFYPFTKSFNFIW